MTSTISVESAFAAAWADCRNPELDGTNPHFRNRFASLKATLHVVRAACAAHGIAYSQTITSTDAGTFLTSRVFSAEGGCLELSTMPLDRPSNPQAFGSNITYAKRQLAQADWGITGDEDDDAEAAARSIANRAQPMPAPIPITVDQQANIADLVRKIGVTDEQLAYAVGWASMPQGRVSTVEDMTEAEADKLIDSMLSKAHEGQQEQAVLDVEVVADEEADQ